MSQFLNTATLTPDGQSEDTRASFDLDADLKYEIGQPGSGWIITVPKGFRTDGPSIPWWAAWAQPAGEIFLPSILHDYLRHLPGVSLWTGNLLYLDACLAVGVPTWRALVLFLAVSTNTDRD